MPDWLKHLIIDVSAVGIIAKICMTALTVVLGYYIKQILDAIRAGGKRKKGRFLVSFQDYYGEEFERHRQKYVQRLLEPGGTEASEARAVVEEIIRWTKGPTHFLILSGEGAIGKSRCCIEAAKAIEMKWIPIKGYKDTAPELLVAGLNDLVREDMVCVYEDYQEFPNAFGKVVDLIIRKKAKLLVVSREEERPKREIENREPPELIQLRKLADETLRAIAQEKAKLKEVELDELTLQSVIRISAGIPGIVILAVDQYAKKKTLQGIENYEQLLRSIYTNLQNSSRDSWEIIRPLLGKMALVRGVDGKVLGQNYEKIRLAMYAGQIVNGYDGNFRIQPDILNDYIARQVYFEQILSPQSEQNLSPHFEPTVDEFLQTKSGEILVTLINCNHREVVRNAVGILLRKAKALDAKTVVTLGINAYDAFKDLDLVQSKLGEFWNRVWELDDPDDYHKTATLHSLLAKWDDAEKCWNKAIELCQAQNNQWGIGTILNSLGSMCVQKNDLVRAIEFYENALEVFGRVEGDLGIFGSAQTHNSIAIVFANQGEWKKAKDQVDQALASFGRLAGENGVYGKAQTYLVRGNIAHRLGEKSEAIQLYEVARKGFEDVKNGPGRAKAYTALSLVYADSAQWEVAKQFFEKAMDIMNSFGDRYSIAQIYRDFGSLYLRKGDWDNAEKFYHDAHETSKQLGDTRGAADALIGSASIHQGKGNWDEAVQSYEIAQQSFQVLGDANGSAQIDLGLGSVYLAKGDMNLAEGSYLRAMATFEQSGNRNGKALASLNLGAVYQRRSDYARAIELYEDARETFEQMGNQLGTANVYLNLGLAHQEKSDWDSALQSYRESLRISEEIGNGREILRADIRIGSIYQARGEWDLAIEIYKNALKYYEELDDPLGKTDVSIDLGSVYDGKGEWEKALRLYQEALTISEKLQNDEGIARASSGLAAIHEKRGNWKLAFEFYQNVLKVYENLGNRIGMASTYLSLGWILHRQGASEQAFKYCQKSLAIWDEIGNEGGKADTYTTLGAIHDEIGNYEEAIRDFQQSLDVYEKLGSPSGSAAIYNNLGLVYRKQGEHDEAIRLCELSLAISTKLGYQQLESYTYTILGMVHSDQGDWVNAMQFFEKGLQIKKALKDYHGLAYSHGEMGLMYMNKQEWDEAEDFLLESFRSFSILGAKIDAARVLGHLKELTTTSEHRGDQARVRRVEEAISVNQPQLPAPPGESP